MNHYLQSPALTETSFLRQRVRWRTFWVLYAHLQAERFGERHGSGRLAVRDVGLLLIEQQLIISSVDPTCHPCLRNAWQHPLGAQAGIAATVGAQI